MKQRQPARRLNILYSETARGVVSQTKDILTIGALLAAGWWFYESRQTQPQILLTHDVTHRVIGDRFIWIRLKSTIENTGKILAKPESLTPRLHVVKPAKASTLDMLKNFRPDLNNDNLVSWPLPPPFKEDHTYYIRKIENTSLEPGEKWFVDSDFVLDTEEISAQTVVLYSFVTVKGVKDLVWDASTVYEIERKEKCAKAPSASQRNEDKQASPIQHTEGGN